MSETLDVEQNMQDIKDDPTNQAMSDEAVLSEFTNFNKTHNSVILGTINKDGNADTSYAPCLQKEGFFYVYVSELAVHSANLFNHLNASLLFIEPEKKTNLFKRKRSTIRVEAGVVARDSTKFVEIMDDYMENFGSIMHVLRDSQDFHLFRLTPQSGTYVRGFGQAYHITGQKLDTIKHMRDRGHGQSKMNEREQHSVAK